MSAPEVDPVILETERRVLASIAGHPVKILRAYDALGSRLSLETHRDILAALVSLATTDRPSTLSAVAHGFSTRGKGEKRFVAAAARARDMIAYAAEIDLEAELRGLGTVYGFRDARVGIPDPGAFEARHASLDEYASSVEDYARRLRDAAQALKPLTSTQLAVHLDDALKESADEDDSADWLIEGLIGRRSIGMLAGAPQQGKSTLAVQLAMCIANGRSVLNHNVAQQSRILYLIAEGSRAQFLSRVRTAVRALSVHAPSGPWFMQANGADVFEIGKPGFESIIANSQPDIVVLDTVFKFAVGVNENHADEWRAKIYRPLFDLTARYGTSFLLLHHAKKNGTGGWEDVAGSFAMYGDTDFFMRLTVDPQEPESATLHLDKVRGRPKGSIPLTFLPESALFAAGRPPVRYNQSDADIKPRVLDIVITDAAGVAGGGGVTTRHIVPRLKETGFPGVTTSSVTATLAQLVREGSLEKFGGGWRKPLDQKALFEGKS